MSHRDAISMKTRTWPYGTKIKVKVLHVEGPVMICVDPVANEGYIIVDGYDDEDQAKRHDMGEIEFTEGGPTGGHWRYRKGA